jgi:hypothetical protein
MKNLTDEIFPEQSCFPSAWGACYVHWYTGFQVEMHMSDENLLLPKSWLWGH